jgi:hypothetical protein
MFGGSSTGATGLEELLAQLQQQEGAVEPQGKSVLGLLGNLISGAAAVGGGIGKWALNDLIAAGQEAATLGRAETDWMTDDIAKAMAGYDQTDPRTGEKHPGFHPSQSVIARDLGERYGMLLPGGRPASEILSKAYEDPLSYILDAASVASGAGTLGAKAGRMMLPKGSYANTLAQTVASDLRAVPGVSARAAARAGTRAGLEELGTQAGPLGELVKHLLPQQTFRTVEAGTKASSMFLPTTTAVNPLYRPLGSLMRRFTTQPVPEFQKIVQTLGDDIADAQRMTRSVLPDGTPLGQAEAKLNLYQEMLQGLKENKLTRVEKPFFRSPEGPYVRWTAHRIEKKLGMENLLRREKELKATRDLINRYLDQDAATGAKSMVDYHLTSTGLDVNLDGVPMEMWASSQIEGMPGPTVRLGDIAEPVDDTLDDAVMANARAADPGFAARTEEMIGKLREQIQRYETDPDPDGLTTLLGARFSTDVATEIDSTRRIIRGLYDGLRRHTDDMQNVGQRSPAAKLADEMRLLDIEQRFPRIQQYQYTPTRHLERLYGPMREKYASMGLLPENPALAARQSVLDRLENLTRLQDEIAARLGTSRSAKGNLRFVRRVLGEQRFQPARQVLEEIADDPAALVDELVRQDPEGGILLQVLEGQRPLALSAPQPGRVVGPTFRGLPDVSPSAATPMPQQRMLTTPRQAPVGRVSTLAAEIRDAVGPENMELLFAGTRSAHDITRRIRTLFENPAQVMRGAVDALDTAPDVKLLDDAFHRAGIAQPVYYPYIDISRPGMHEFFPSRRLAGANKIAADPSEKQFMGVLLREGSYVMDPLEAWNRRAARRAREVNTYESMMTRISQMGRQVQSKEELPPGWVAISPDALFMNHRAHLRFQTAVENYRLNGLDVDDAVARALDDVGNEAIDSVDTLLKSQKPVMYAIPKAVADEMSGAARWAQVASPKLVRSAFDPMMNAWRGIVLTGSPRWIVNNVLGNITFGAMQGVKTMDVMRLLTERFRRLAADWASRHGEVGRAVAELLGGTDYRKKSLVRAVKDLEEAGNIQIGSGFFESPQERYIARLGEAADTATGRWVERFRTSTSRAATWPRRYSDSVRRLNGEIEEAFREASFLAGVEKIQGRGALHRTLRSFDSAQRRITDIMENGYSESIARKAMEDVYHFYGDYTALGPFERHVMRRFLMPFYGFWKHTVKLLFTFPIEQPFRAEVFRMISKAQEEMIEQYGPMPEWLERTGIPQGPPGAEVPFLLSAGANPFTGATQDPVSMLSPPIKMVLERSLGRNLFTGKRFSDANTIMPFGSDQAYALNPETGEVEPVAAPVPGLLESALQQLPQYNLVKDALAGGATYDTATLPDVMQGKGVIRDLETGEPRYPTGWAEALSKFMGATNLTYDLGSYQEQLTEDQKAVVRELLNRIVASQGGTGPETSTAGSWMVA